MISTIEFKREVSNWAQELAVKPKEVHIRSMATKWASCSSKGRITFSSALLNEPTETRTKVIVHELRHLKYPHHGKIFKTLLTSYLNKHEIKSSFDEALKIN